MAAETAELVGTIEMVKSAAEQALAHESAEGMEMVERQLAHVESSVRELQQTFWCTEIKAAIRNLENGRPLTPQDKQVVRHFIVSDAEHYLRVENNYGDWVQELRRLLGSIAAAAPGVTRETIGELRGTIKDAQRVIPDIRNYLDEQRRLDIFEEQIDKLDEQSRGVLVRLLREKLTMPNF
ncbi:hypothetical protein RAS1_05470 [Phycisphaerae bacterium RAS1]|nr:hypothetical protein RAS1_05470 [Phycisphaerae bacterium RAS1]